MAWLRVQLTEELLQARPQFAPALNNAAAAYWELHKREQAVACCQRVLSFDPINVYALANLTHLLFHPHHEETGRSFLPLEQVRALLTSKCLTSLTHLQLRLSDLGDDGCG